MPTYERRTRRTARESRRGRARTRTAWVLALTMTMALAVPVLATADAPPGQAVKADRAAAPQGKAHAYGRAVTGAHAYGRALVRALASARAGDEEDAEVAREHGDTDGDVGGGAGAVAEPEGSTDDGSGTTTDAASDEEAATRSDPPEASGGDSGEPSAGVTGGGPTPEQRDCTITLPPGESHQPSAGPGDVICLAAGTHGDLRLYDLEGTPDEPITVRNEGGVATLDATGEWVGLRIENSRHLHVTGTGVAARCGAAHAEDEQECGIRVTGSEDGIGAKVRSEYLTFDHVEVADVSDTGITTRDKSLGRGEWVQRDVAFRDLYVHDIADEGHYHGSSSYRGGDEHLLDGVEVTRNLVVRTGRDGIQVGSTPWNCRIADNVVAETGLNGESSHAFGIIVNRGASCDVTGNHVADSAGDGIYDQGLHGQTIADNTIVRSGLTQDGAGINVREGDQAADNPETPDYPRSTHVLRNRIEGTSEHGIRLRNHAGEDNRIHDNHLSGIGSGDAIDYGDGATADESGNVAG